MGTIFGRFIRLFKAVLKTGKQLSKGAVRIVDQNSVRKINQKLLTKQVNTIPKASPEESETFTNHTVVNDVRFVGRSFRGVF